MEDFYELNSTNHKPWKKILSIILAVIIGFGTIVTLTVGSSRLQDWLGIQSMLSAYASEIVDTEGAVAVDENAMLADNHTINLENKDGSNTVYLFSEPISFVDDNGNLKTKDISVKKQTDKKLKDNGYDYTNGQNDYRINFSKDSSKGIEAVIGNYSYSIIPYSDTKAEGTESSAEFLNEKFEVFQYENIYGEGTNLRFYPQLNGVKDEIVLNRNINQNSFSFELKTNNCTAKLNDDGAISIINNDDIVIQTFTAPFAYDSEYVEGDLNSHYVDCEYSLIDKDETSYIMTITVPNEWLTSDSTKYPVIIDPTTSQLGNYRDAGIYNKSTSASICYGKEATCCFGRASEYGYGRVLNQFTMPSEIKKGAVINSAYSWQRETTGRTTSTKVTPHMVTSAWYEGEVTWKTRPTYNSVTGTTRTISSKSTDDPDNKYWYKFNITNMVQKWADGTNTNYGFCFESSEETDGNYNWRAFTSRQYSSSAMRPYTVINYTNDTTAPTATINVSTTSWTNGSVVLSVSNAKDNNGGSGLNSSAYSFSTSASEYCWGTTTSKSFDLNTTVYISVRDAVGNIKTYTQKISNIDKTAPSVSSVTGNPTKWTMDKVTLTASSNDSESGIKDYSFSSTEGAYSWQSENTKTFSENQTVYIYSRDNAGNISEPVQIDINKIAPNESYFLKPELYTDGCLTGIINPRNNDDSLLYKIGENGEWTKYKAPFALPLYQESTVYAKFEDSDEIVSKKITPDSSRLGEYKENSIDFSMKYKTVSFDFVREYSSVNKKWFFSTDSTVSKESDYIYSAVLTNGMRVKFFKSSVGVYTDNKNGYILNVSENGYIIQIGNINYIYNSEGVLESVESKYGDSILIAREESSITISDGAERKYVLELDLNKNIVSVTDPAGNMIKYEYDNNNNLSEVINQEGVIVGKYSYLNGLLKKSSDKSIEYNSDGRVTSYEYDNGAYTNYVYDDKNKTVFIEDSTEKTVLYSYNDALNIVSSVDEKGNKTEYQYDEFNRIIMQTTSDNKIRYEYKNNSSHSIIHTISTNKSEKIYYKYDEKNRLIREQKGNECLYYSYDDDGNIIVKAKYKSEQNGTPPLYYSENSSEFDTIVYTYDNGVLKKAVDSKSAETVSYKYDEYGNILKTDTVRNDNNSDTSYLRIVNFTYDILGNLLSSSSDNKLNEYIYDKTNNLIYSNENGEISRTVYDEYGRIVQYITTEDYDKSKDGLPESNTYSDKNAGVTYSYNSNGTVAKVKNRLGKVTEYTYNDRGSLALAEFDIYKFHYINHGEVSKIDIGGKTAVTYQYDEKFNLIAEKYSNGGSRTYEYLEGKVSRQYFDGNEKDDVTYEYNSDGSLATKTINLLNYFYSCTEKLYGEGINGSQEIAHLVFVTKSNKDKNIPDDITSLHFGQVYHIVHGENSIVFSRDIINNDSTETNNSSNSSKSFEYNFEHDENENNVLGRIKSNVTFTSHNKIDEEGNIVNRYYENLSKKYSFETVYDKDNKLVSINSKYGDLDYIENYTYDEKGQLIKSNGTNNCEYEYDERGNIVSKSVNGEKSDFAYSQDGWKDRLLSVNGVPITYDDMGNPVSYANRQFKWKVGRYLSELTDGENKYSYNYDDNGMRISKDINGVKTFYNYEQGKLISQKDSNGNSIYFQYAENGTPLGLVYNHIQYYYITNQLGDIVALADEDGKIVCEYVYGDWGEILDITGDLEIAEANPLRYRGYYYDNETGYYYLQSRYYDPNICRFINADIFSLVSIDTLLGINIFIYCQNDPINFIDPTGFYKTTNWFEVALRTLCLSIEFDSITRAFEKIIQKINSSFNLEEWYEDLSYKTQNFFNELVLATTSCLNTLYIKIKESIDFSNILNELNIALSEYTFDGLINEIIKKIHWGASEYSFFQVWKTFADVFNNTQENKLSITQSVVLMITNISLTIVSIIIPDKAFVGTIIRFVNNLCFDILFNYQNGNWWG